MRTIQFFTLSVLLLTIQNGCSLEPEDSVLGPLGSSSTIKPGESVPSSNGTNPHLAFTSELWEGQGWSFNNNFGAWFPTVSDNAKSASFGIDDFSWGQLRTKFSIELGQTVHLLTTVYLNSGGVNGDAAIFGFGENWAFYSGNGMGIIIEDGVIRFFKTVGGTIERLDVIGSYTSGDRLNLKLTLNLDGSLSAFGPGFKGTYTPDFSIASHRVLISSKDSSPEGGFSVGPILLNKNNGASQAGREPSN